MTDSKEDLYFGNYLNKMNFVTREQWGAKKPKMYREMKTPIPYVVFTYSQTNGCNTKSTCIDNVFQLQACAMASCELSDIKANFLIGGDGRVYEGRGWTNSPERYEGYFEKLSPLNRKCIEIAFIGRKNVEPTNKQAEAAELLIREGIEKNMLAKDVKLTTLFKEHTIPKRVRTIENVRVSRHVTSDQDDPFQGWTLVD